MNMDIVILRVTVENEYGALRHRHRGKVRTGSWNHGLVLRIVFDTDVVVANSKDCFFSARKRKPEDDLETKPFPKKHKETSKVKETTEGFACSLEQKPGQNNLISVKAVPVTQKTLFVAGLSRQTNISDIIDFFKDVGQVVHVRLCALETKNGEYLHSCKIFIGVVETSTYHPPKFCLDHKVWNVDSLQLEKEKEEDETPSDFVVEELLVIANLSPHTKISHIRNFFHHVARVVSVRLVVNGEGKNVGYGFVEFASAHHANTALELKNGEYLHDHKILLMKGHYQTPAFVEEAAITKTLFISNLSKTIKISDIINFFKVVGEVAHVRLIANSQGQEPRPWGFVEFASATEVEKALVKNGEYLHGRKMCLEAAKTVPLSPPKFCLDHKVWYEDYLRQESLLMGEDEAVKGLYETPNFLEEVAARKNTLFLANLPYDCQIIPTIISYFRHVGEIVHVRIMVDNMGEHLGCGYVEFASSNEAEKALLQKKKYLGYMNIFVDVAEIAPPYPVGPKYNLAKKLCYDDNLRRGIMMTKPNLKKQELGQGIMKTKQNLKKQEVPMKVMGLFCGKKITFSDDDDEKPNTDPALHDNVFKPHN
ncbi:PREDICTED: LOW QUALITY PROTEIN: polyadenylate-binding protein, cytoplasmic and nuclear-like [Camelina sativa]|uniref:LOW QUALITY PROTEIN: polyadenylate-binding protein, cytoplasmic and nuclear-like n=1 Tax=Camelina sativa TaxID=90675 RepID=A0ABM1R2X8_CAMSA|nr:PREDICTED: LOW QUALITY PROTEIN: polyadenylate-binding protein, cytoplasmic and nuclear-like [Camelina sativa]